MKKTYFTLKEIAEITHASLILRTSDPEIKSISIDSRKIISPAETLFFAITGQRDGHDFIADAYSYGVRNFVITRPAVADQHQGANFLVVRDSLSALQELAAAHRAHFDLKVIAVTGSNGKTVVKEWLYQLLATDLNIVRSPKSYNSQIGVPLSVWQINESHDLGIFEAGISGKNEMEKLEAAIKPSIGILTNLKEAHALGFDSPLNKLEEKLKLFRNTEMFIYAPDYLTGILPKNIPGRSKFTWSTTQAADLYVFAIEPIEGKTYLRARYKQEDIECLLPFSDKASVENGIICWATLLVMGYSPEAADERLEKLLRVGMRLELKNGINNCSVIDDSYSADIASLAIALDFLNQQNQHLKKTIILSDIHETGQSGEDLYREVAALLTQKSIHRLIGIGPEIGEYAPLFDLEALFFNDTHDFLNSFPGMHFEKESILVKGSRKFEFERISRMLTQKLHDTVLEIDLTALTANLNFYRSKLRPGVKVMAMVKAFSYGSGSFEIANLLQFQKVDYLAVAYADEGIALRKAGITMPVMVMSPEPGAFEAIIRYKLEPELYNMDILLSFLSYLEGKESRYPVHLKIDTGMHRLGFEAADIAQVAEIISANAGIEVISIFSHLAGSSSAEMDEFTDAQIRKFTAICAEFTAQTGCSPMRHILNTSGISTRPDAQMDMVRIGIGLYGYDPVVGKQGRLQTVAVLKTTVTQVKQILPHETVGYDRNGVMAQGGKIATVKIGYADGYSRAFGEGKGKMLVNGILAPVIGSVCMDMCMLNVTGIDVKTGDEVIVFNDQLTIKHLADQAGTIPYEILTNISQRVKRVYFYE